MDRGNGPLILTKRLFSVHSFVLFHFKNHWCSLCYIFVSTSRKYLRICVCKTPGELFMCGSQAHISVVRLIVISENNVQVSA